MAHVTEPFSGDWTAVDLVERFGPIPLHRVRMTPPPGTATEEDVVELREREGRLFELIDGVLVEKDMGWYESHLAALLIRLLGAYVEENNLGTVLGADGMARLARGQVRIPDVSVVFWERLRKASSKEAVFPLAPDLAVEVISPGNTAAEMRRKLADYFAAGVKEVWYIYPDRKIVQIHLGNEESITVEQSQKFEGTPLLPGLQLDLAKFFAPLTKA